MTDNHRSVVQRAARAEQITEQRGAELAVDSLPRFRIRGEIDFGICFAVHYAGLLSKEISNRLIVAIIFEECFVCTNDLSVLCQSLTYARTQANDSLDSFGWQE